MVRQAHYADPDIKLAFTGSVLDCEIRDGEAVFSCEPVIAALRRSGLRRNYQPGLSLCAVSGAVWGIEGRSNDIGTGAVADVQCADV